MGLKINLEWNVNKCDVIIQLVHVTSEADALQVGKT